jgi:hypothetical protein
MSDSIDVDPQALDRVRASRGRPSWPEEQRSAG